MRYAARHIGSGVWGIWDGGVMSWIATDLSENEAKQKAADKNVMFDQYGQRSESERREVDPPRPVAWWGRVRGPDGHYVWIKASDLRQAKEE